MTKKVNATLLPTDKWTEPKTASELERKNTLTASWYRVRFGKEQVAKPNQGK